MNKQQELNGLEFDTQLEEDEELDSSKERGHIFTNQGDPEIESLYGKYKRGKLIVQPDFQRHFVWDTAKASRLIESVLLDIPLPVIYLSEEEDGKEYVIDGQQRLTSFFSFIDGKFPDNDKEFKLTGLKVFGEYNRKRFKELDEELQDKIRYHKIRTITVRKETDRTLKFEIFERLNTGAVSLNDQELRNCVYRGCYNELIKELSTDVDFRFLLGLKAPDKRMRNVKLVLRFASFFHSTYLNYKSPMKKFLNLDMEKYQNITENDKNELRKAFKNTISIIKSLLANHAFRRFYKGDDKNPNGYWEPTGFNTSLFDILMYSFAKEDKNIVYQNLDSIREAFIDLMSTNQDFIDSIGVATGNLQAVTKRFDIWRLTLQNIIGVGQREPRLFTFEFKKKLFEKNETCSICGQRINHLDDSAVDHIDQYWLGGKTIPENARLTHRYCNFSRSRKEY